MGRGELVKRAWPAFTVLAATSVLFGLKGIFSFLMLETPAGRDLIGSYAFSWLMEQNLLHGELLRWSNDWMLGFPSFSFYPPLFFLLTALLNLLTGGIVGLKTWFVLLAFSTVFLYPIVAYLSFSHLRDRFESLFIGLFSLYFLFVYPPVSQAYQVLSVGLVAQGLSLLLAVPGIALLFSERDRSDLASGLLLGLSLLSHPFAGLSGMLVAGFYLLQTRERGALLSMGVATAVVLPWAVNALVYFPYLPKYTFGTARVGLSLLMLLPLVFLGGLRSEENRSMLAAFLTLLLVGTVEIPLVTQELRFFTYALAVGSLLAGAGAYRIYENLKGKLHPALLLALLVTPVIGLSLQADTVRSWDYQGSAGELMEGLEGRREGRVLVETRNSSIYDAYVPQELIPLRTSHSAVNELHLDSSTSASYILTLESWLSKNALYNPICRTCDTNASDDLVDRRMDDLGVRYFVARTREAAGRASRFMEPLGRYGGFRLFENREGHRLVEPLEVRPVALEGSFDKWRRVNDRLFVSDATVPLAWTEKAEDPNRFSQVISMGGKTASEILRRVKDTSLEPVRSADANLTLEGGRAVLEADRSSPVRLKLSWSPRHRSNAPLYASNFNTLVVWPGNYTEIILN
ncbi:MAG: hypothetical protein ABEJ69_00060 [Candidatus Nanohaloarchaea archaeon]